ncbi:FISUMP domain-containing protein [Elizabethkingia anophelis]|uniref:FISUMP domain-containing protein n=1 Tax=Elizabethkingia anophelis TaxID=1117645 RepID=UPI0038918EE8
MGKTIDLPNSFKITPEYKSNLTINLRKCGAYIGPNTDPANYKEFMCQNLGSTEGINPFSPEAGNHGAKYQWGAQKEETGRYISQANDQSNSGSIPGWNSTPKPDGSWSDTSKTANDPCPSGYRVPTKAQWQAVINNNPNIERVGSWDENGNYTTALYFRSSSNIRTLMLPAAGYRHYAGGALLSSRGENGYFWSTSEAVSNASYLSFGSTRVNVNGDNRSYGLSVRCVAE